MSRGCDEWLHSLEMDIMGAGVGLASRHEGGGSDEDVFPCGAPSDDGLRERRWGKRLYVSTCCK